mgnify:FL=1
MCASARPHTGSPLEVRPTEPLKGSSRKSPSPKTESVNMESGRHRVLPITVPTQLRRPLPLVADLLAAAKDAEEDKGVLALNYSKVLRVRTSRKCLTRALILINTLIKEFESRGYGVRIGERVETELILEEGAISVRLDERTKQVAPPPPSPRPKTGQLPPSYEPWRPAYLLVATGEFTLTFGRYRLSGCRHSWRDRPGATLESQLHEVMEAIPSWDETLKARRLEREDLELLAKEAQARRVAKAREQEILRRQRARLVDGLSAWENAERLRRYIAAVQDASCQSKEKREWLDWANDQVRLLDPLCSRLVAVTDLAINLDAHFTGNPMWEKPAKDWWSP